MAAAEKDRIRFKRGSDEKGSRAFGTMEFMAANGDEVGVELVGGRKWFFSKHLNRVRVKKNAAFAAKGSDLGDGLDCASFIVGGHHGNEHRIRANGGFYCANRDLSGLIDGQKSDLEAFFIR